MIKGGTMGFQRLTGGNGGFAAEVVQSAEPAEPGGRLTGTVVLRAGTVPVTVDSVRLTLTAQLAHYPALPREVAEGGRYPRPRTSWARRPSSDTDLLAERVPGAAGKIAAGEERTLPFTLALPAWLPVPGLHGQELGGFLGVRADADLRRARDHTSGSTVAVTPPPAWDAVYRTFLGLG
ncbi:sporulation protein [Streptomyces sp. CAU 1734]|uniref:sporulation protein n=1 Tax=Streptomyces sp. CAU 1734 TaxID=3140360 RepID=UPI003261CAA4